MRNLILEACVDSAESAQVASQGGADRFELCQNLIIGGTTPSPGLFEQVSRVSDRPIRVLIRPRFGDFLYTEAELEAMLTDIRYFREAGAQAVVTGALNAEGRLDIEAMKRLREAAGPMEFTLHRAIDVAVDALEVVEQSVSLGIDTILTSGQAATALEGLDLLKQMNEQAGGRLTILAAGGVSAAVIPALHEAGLVAYHMSGKTILNSAMRFRRPEVSMGMPGISEFQIWRSTEENFRAAREAVDRLRA